MLKIIDKVMDVPLYNQIGEFLSGAYRTEKNGKLAEHFLLYLNLANLPCNVRINSACFSGDLFGDSRCDCSWQLQQSIKYIHRNNQGLIIYHLHHEGRANGLLAKLHSYNLSDYFSVSSKNSYQRLGLPADSRLFESSALILKDLKVNLVNLMSNNPKKKYVLENNGISVSTIIPLVSKDPKLADYYQLKRKDFHHYI